MRSIEFTIEFLAIKLRFSYYTQHRDETNGKRTTPAAQPPKSPEENQAVRSTPIPVDAKGLGVEGYSQGREDAVLGVAGAQRQERVWSSVGRGPNTVDPPSLLRNLQRPDPNRPGDRPSVPQPVVLQPSPPLAEAPAEARHGECPVRGSVSNQYAEWTHEIETGQQTLPWGALTDNTPYKGLGW